MLCRAMAMPGYSVQRSACQAKANIMEQLSEKNKKNKDNYRKALKKRRNRQNIGKH